MKRRILWILIRVADCSQIEKIIDKQIPTGTISLICKHLTILSFHPQSGFWSLDDSPKWRRKFLAVCFEESYVPSRATECTDGTAQAYGSCFIAAEPLLENNRNFMENAWQTRKSPNQSDPSDYIIDRRTAFLPKYFSPRRALLRDCTNSLSKSWAYFSLPQNAHPLCNSAHCLPSSIRRSFCTVAHPYREFK